MIGRYMLCVASTLLCVGSVDWCSESLQCGEAYNTMCLYRHQTKMGNIQSIRSILDPDMRKTLLAFHNRIRDKVASGGMEGFERAANMRQFTWSESLEDLATVWAEQCKGNESDTCRKTQTFPDVGQNVWTECSLVEFPEFETILHRFGSAGGEVTKDVVGSFVRDTNADGHQSYGMFTQVIWAETYHLGCGVVTYNITKAIPKNSIPKLCSAVVCNYEPAGNQEGKPIYIPGRPGKKCPELTSIRMSILSGRSSSVYPNLCAYPSDPKSEFRIPMSNAQLTIYEDTTIYWFHHLPLEAVINNASSFNYWCSQEAHCRIGKNRVQNTVCKFKNQSGINCEGVATVATTPEDRYMLLALHNTFRNHLAAGKLGHWPTASNMRQMTWDSQLELLASRWALQCVEGHDDCRKTPRFKYVGQNCGSAGAIGEFLGHDIAFHLWAGQLPVASKSLIQRFVYGKEYAEFAQIAWAESYKVGCSLVHFINEVQFFTVYTVCNYGPAGAITKRQMYRRGIPCGECPPGTRCKTGTTYPKLCALPDDPTDEYLPEQFIKKAKEYRSGQRSITISWNSIVLFMCARFVLHE